MAKKHKQKDVLNSTPGFERATLREEISGKRQFKGAKDIRANLRLVHLQKLATWASGEASLFPLGAFYGQNLASEVEKIGFPLGPSVFSCQRCETVLQPGYNCSVRIVKNKVKGLHRKSSTKWQNNVVYTCSYCRHLNVKRGTSKGQLKTLLNTDATITLEEQKTLLDSTPRTSSAAGKLCKGISFMSKLESLQPSDRIGESVKRNPSGGASGSRKRRRKNWSTLKEIAENSKKERRQDIGDFKVPFFL